MTLEIMAFGITKDIVGQTIFQLNVPSGSTVKELKETLVDKYPKIEELKSLLIAVNEEYGDEMHVLSERDEIALIPPVSGG
ncbi:MAG: molybdopterin converting factor subunit 1 [Bacteroidota bacterium]